MGAPIGKRGGEITLSSSRRSHTLFSSNQYEAHCAQSVAIHEVEDRRRATKVSDGDHDLVICEEINEPIHIAPNHVGFRSGARGLGVGSGVERLLSEIDAIPLDLLSPVNKRVAASPVALEEPPPHRHAVVSANTI